MTPARRNSKIDAYIANAPVGARAKLTALRRIIRGVVPDAEEVLSYGMPGYSYPALPYKGMVAWFALRSSYIGLYVRQTTIRDHAPLLRGYVTTKNAVHIPLDGPVPKGLIERLVRASASAAKSG